MCAEMNDGHMFVELSEPKEKSNEATASLMLTEAEGKIVVKKISNNKLSNVELGDRVDSIEHQDHQISVVKGKISLRIATMEKIKIVSYGAKQPQKHECTYLNLWDNGKRNFLAERNMVGQGYRSGYENEPYTKEGWLKPDIYFINLSRDSVTKRLIKEELFSAKAIIFDLRGYPLNDEVFNILPHLINKPLKRNNFSLFLRLYIQILKRLAMWEFRQN